MVAGVQKTEFSGGATVEITFDDEQTSPLLISEALMKNGYTATPTPALPAVGK